MTKTTLVCFRHGDLERPVLKVEEAADRIVIAFRSERGEHLTLHPRPDRPILLAHSGPDKPEGTWDAMRIEVARRRGVPDPERHGKYYVQREVWPRVEGMDGHELVGRRIDLDAAPATTKYDAADRIVVDSSSRVFMLTIHLSTEQQPYSAPDEPHVETALGDLYFRPGAFPMARAKPIPAGP